MTTPTLAPVAPAAPPVSWRTREEIANITLHAFGFFFSLIGFGVLVALAARTGSTLHIVSSSVYAASLLMVYIGSLLFHTSLALDLAWKKALEIVDHCAIFLLIAGTYTPFLMVSLGGALGWGMLALVWSLAIGGILYKIFRYYRSDLLSTLAYIAMGWLSVFIAWPLYGVIGIGGMGLLVLGGVFYTIGAVFYLKDKSFRFAHAVWHLFVLVASLCHYAAILAFVINRPA